jgi:hypothetical protein
MLNRGRTTQILRWSDDGVPGAEQPSATGSWYESTGEAFVAVMEATDLRNGDHSSDPGRHAKRIVHDLAGPSAVTNHASDQLNGLGGRVQIADHRPVDLEHRILRAVLNKVVRNRSRASRRGWPHADNDNPTYRLRSGL